MAVRFCNNTLEVLGYGVRYYIGTGHMREHRVFEYWARLRMPETGYVGLGNLSG